MELKRLLTIKEVEVLYNISRTTIGTWRDEGKISSIRLCGGKPVRFHPDILAKEMEVLTGKSNIA